MNRHPATARASQPTAPPPTSTQDYPDSPKTLKPHRGFKRKRTIFWLSLAVVLIWVLRVFKVVSPTQIKYIPPTFTRPSFTKPTFTKPSFSRPTLGKDVDSFKSWISGGGDKKVPWRIAQERYCKLQELDEGHWIPKASIASSVEEVIKSQYGSQAHRRLDYPDKRFQHASGLYAMGPSPETYLASVYPRTTLLNGDIPTQVGIDEERLVNVSNWEWRPRNCNVRPWNWTRLVRRLLQSKTGLVVFGDSISGQHFDSIAFYLGNDGPIYEEFNGIANSADLPRRLVFDPTHPQSKTVLDNLLLHPTRQAQISRGENITLAFFHRDDLSATRDELVKYQERLGFPKDSFAPGAGDHIYDFFSILKNLLELGAGETEGIGEKKWPSVAWNASRTYEGDGDGWKPSFLIKNTGAHWVLNRVQRGNLGQDAMNLLYNYAARRSIERISSLDGEVILMYRATNVAHKSCWDYSQPAETYPLSPTDSAYGWDTFPYLNSVWKKAIQSIQRKDKTIALYFEFDNMLSHRPDAHRWPWSAGETLNMPIDCLHLTLPGPIDYWLTWPAHVIEEEGL